MYVYIYVYFVVVDGAKKRSYDVNQRFVYTVTSFGGHDVTARAICGNMNLPPPVHTYDDHISSITIAATETAAESMNTAVSEAKVKLDNNDISVSVDGTWQKRGYSSRNGVVICLSNVGEY